MSDDPADRGLSAAQIAKQIDASLARLQTDYVDLYQAHRFDPDVPIEETIEALQQVVAVGQGALPRLQRVDARADPGGDRHRRARPVRLLAAAVLDAVAGARGRALPALRRQRHLADRLVAARPGAADRQVPARARRRRRTRARPTARWARRWQLLHERRRPRGRRPPAAGRRGGGPDAWRELALAWVLRRAELASAIVGASRPEQVARQREGVGRSSSRPRRSQAIDEALGDAPIKEPTLAPFAQPGVTHR